MRPNTFALSTNSIQSDCQAPVLAPVLAPTTGAILVSSLAPVLVPSLAPTPAPSPAPIPAPIFCATEHMARKAKFTLCSCRFRSIMGGCKNLGPELGPELGSVWGRNWGRNWGPGLFHSFGRHWGRRVVVASLRPPCCRRVIATASVPPSCGQRPIAGAWVLSPLLPPSRCHRSLHAAPVPPWCLWPCGLRLVVAAFLPPPQCILPDAAVPWLPFHWPAMAGSGHWTPK